MAGGRSRKCPILQTRSDLYGPIHPEPGTSVLPGRAHRAGSPVRYIREEMRQAAPGRIPTAWELRSYFQFPDRPTALTAWQQILAVDKLLEYAEINLRTLCDLLRYRQLKGFGVVHSVDEFTALCHPHAKESEE